MKTNVHKSKIQGDVPRGTLLNNLFLLIRVY